jgi:hypothetical protein
VIWVGLEVVEVAAYELLQVRIPGFVELPLFQVSMVAGKR